MWHRLSSEPGQDTVEWGGVLAVVALMIGALLASGVLASVASGFECGVQKVLGGAASCIHRPGQPTQGPTQASGPTGSPKAAPATTGRGPTAADPRPSVSPATPQDLACPRGSSPAAGPWLNDQRPCVTASGAFVRSLCPQGSAPAYGTWPPGKPCLTASGEPMPLAAATAADPCPAGMIPDISSAADGPPWSCVPGTTPPSRNPWLPATIQPDPWPGSSCPVGFDYHTYERAAYCESRWVDGYPGQLEEAPDLPASWQPPAAYSLNDLLNGKNPNVPNGQEVATPEGYGSHAVVGPADPSEPNGGLQYFPNGPEEESIYNKILEGLQEQWKEKASDIFDDLEKREEVERQLENAAARQADAETNGVQYPNDPAGGEDGEPAGGEDGEPVDPLPPLVEGGEVGGE